MGTGASTTGSSAGASAFRATRAKAGEVSGVPPGVRPLRASLEISAPLLDAAPGRGPDSRAQDATRSARRRNTGERQHTAVRPVGGSTSSPTLRLARSIRGIPTLHEASPGGPSRSRGGRAQRPITTSLEVRGRLCELESTRLSRIQSALLSALAPSVGREGFEPPTPCASCKPRTVHLVHGVHSSVVASMACRCVQAAHKCSTVHGVTSRDVACRAVLPCLRQPPERALATFVATSTAHLPVRPNQAQVQQPRSPLSGVRSGPEARALRTRHPAFGATRTLRSRRAFWDAVRFAVEQRVTPNRYAFGK
jgi:hypothetical protein